MLPLFDMMLQAQNGKAMEAMGQQFNLAQEQVAKAMAALTPAFSSGLKRNAADPYDFTGLWSSMTSGGYAKYFEDMGKAFTPQGIADGNSVLERLFGSKDVSRAIAAQAAQMTGIGQDILKQMMPAMADTLMGGLFKQATGQLGGTTNPFSGTPMGTMMEQWLQASGFAPKKPEPVNFFDNPFTKAMQQMMGGVQPTPQAKAESNPFFDNPFAKAFQDMMSGATPAAAAPEAKTEEAKAASGATANPFGEMFNAMFDSGLEVQKSYQKNMEQILDSYLSTAEDAPASDEVADPEAKPSKKK